MAHVSITSTATDYVHQIRSPNHQLIADEPASLGGHDQGMAPFELYLSALAACTAITVRMYAQLKGWDLGQFRAELSSSRDDSGRLQVHRVLYASGMLSDAQWERLLEVVKRTPVTLVMSEGATITSSHGVGP
jgi:putative redox protein